MKNLGLMGEHTFSLWCANAGLVANGSQIDKTGWDFLVEFPFETGLSTHEIHKPAFECKVQVKSTTKKERKLPIKLSVLRRLITAQMPSFFVFIEFDAHESAQKAFVVHIDKHLITQVLERIHKITQSGEEDKLHKRKMTIHYGEKNLLEEPSGECLKKSLLDHIGNNIAEYISQKKSHLESAGYEGGFAKLKFTTEGEDKLKALIDVSLGIEEEVQIAKFETFDTRFGIASPSAVINSQSGKLAMPNLKPDAEGKVRFRQDKLSTGLSFDAKLYNSPFNPMVPDNLKKIRVECELFDLNFNPYTGSASYSFTFDNNERVELKHLRDAIKLLKLVRASGKQVFADLIFEGFPKLEFNVGCNTEHFDFNDEIKALDSAVKIISEFDLTDMVKISIAELSQHSTEINQFANALRPSRNQFKAEFDVHDDNYNSDKQTACIFLIRAAIGSHIFGAFIVLTGQAEKTAQGKYTLITENVMVEKTIVSETNEPPAHNELLKAVEDIEKKYGGNFSVVTTLNKEQT